MSSREMPFAFNHAFRAGMREWVVAIAVLSFFFAFWPRVWERFEAFKPEPEYRLPYELSTDYWFAARWLEAAGREYPCLAVGDSVVWGQYVEMRGTLPSQLNDALGKPVFANAGIDGLHPAAMRGLVTYYGIGWRGKRVLAHFNPLWLTTEERDLRGSPETRFNHPELVSLVFNRPSCVKLPFSEAVSILLSRHIGFFGWTEHIRRVYFDAMPLAGWVMLYPAANPFRAFARGVPEPTKEPRLRPVPWQEAGIQQQDFPWLRAADSFQWAEFRRTVQMLEKRGNSVLVLVGPFNTHMLTPGSAAKYAAMLAEIKHSLASENIPYLAPEPLPSELYADASHPLEKGYELLAERLLENEDFLAWLGEARPGQPVQLEEAQPTDE